MIVHTLTAYLNTTKNLDLLNCTHDVKRAFRESAVQKGLITVYLPVSAGGIVILEKDPQIQEDFKELLSSFVPDNQGPRPARRSGTGAAQAHLRAGLLPVSIGIPVQNGKLLLGPWQEVYVLDADDKASRREVIIHVIGEGAEEKEAPPQRR